MPRRITEPGERIKRLALVNDWHYGLLSRALAVIGPDKSEDEVLLALQEAANNLALAEIRGGANHPDNEALKLKSARLFGFAKTTDFDEALKRPFPGYFSGRYPLPDDAQSEPPVPCDFKVGDVVTYTNDNGIAFHGKVVTGFSPAIENGRFVYLDNEAWWFASSPESLTLEHETEYYVWCDDDCQNKTSSLEEAKKWRDEFVAQGRASWIVDSNNRYIIEGEMQPIEVAQATGQALAWMRAKAEGRETACDFHLNGHHMPGWWVSTKISNVWVPLTDYASRAALRVDSLIASECLAVRRDSKGTWFAIRSEDLGDGEGARWCKYTFKDAIRTGPMSYDVASRQQRFEGSTLDLAATRCFVASKLGLRVDVPADLVGDHTPHEASDEGHEAADSPLLPEKISITHPDPFKELQAGLLEPGEDATKVDVGAADGLLLDWLVGVAKGMNVVVGPTPAQGVFANDGRGYEYFTPSQDGHKIILDSRIEIRHRLAPWNDVEATWCEGTRINQFGPDALTAGLRAFVSGKLGCELHIPNAILCQIHQQQPESESDEQTDFPPPPKG